MPAPFQFTLVKTPVVKALVTKGTTGPAGATGPAGSNATATTDASQLTSGILPDARLSTNVVKAADMQAYAQPLDSDLTAIAALSTTSYGRNLLTLANQAALQAAVGAAGDALTANPLSQFASTTSAQLRGVINDKTGTGALVFASGATFAGTTTFGNGILFDTSTTSRLFSSTTVRYQSNATAVQHRFINDIGSSLTDTLVEMSTSSGSLAANGKMLNIVGNAGTTLCMTVLATGNAGFGIVLPTEKVDVVGNIKATGTITGGIAATSGTFAVVNATTATATLGLRRITDRSNRLAYPDGTNWRFVSDDAIIS